MPQKNNQVRRSFAKHFAVNNVLAFVAGVLFTLTNTLVFAQENIVSAHESLADGLLLGDIDKLDPNKKPGENFELVDWSLSLPVDANDNGIAENIGEVALKNGFEIKPLFFTGQSGGLVFVAPNYGPKTSKNTKYTRSELREMLRRGDASIKTKGVNKNNWVFSSMHRSNQRRAGGVDGSLEATLSVNRVSVTGDEKRLGRVIVGQIHAIKNEPIRLYYHKLPNNTKGSIYFAHETQSGDEQWIEMVGSRSRTSADPEDGIELNEIFSYKISVEEDLLLVTLIRQGKPNITKSVDMSESGYNKADQYMYFKVGVYNQNNTGDKNDFVQATFYYFDNKHKRYKF